MRAPKVIVAELQRTGLPYSLEPGSKHIRIKLRDKLVGIYPLNGRAKEGRAMKNVISQIRRAARELVK